MRVCCATGNLGRYCRSGLSRNGGSRFFVNCDRGFDRDGGLSNGRDGNGV